MPTWLTAQTVTPYHYAKKHLGTSYDVYTVFSIIYFIKKGEHVSSFVAHAKSTRFSPHNNKWDSWRIVTKLHTNTTLFSFVFSETTVYQIDVCCMQCGPGDRRSVTVLHSVRSSSESYPSCAQWKPWPDHLPPSSSRVKNAWSCTSCSSYILNASRWIKCKDTITFYHSGPPLAPHEFLGRGK